MLYLKASTVNFRRAATITASVFLVALCLSTTLSDPAQAFNLREMDRQEINNLQDKLTTCAAYYTITAKGIENSGDRESAVETAKLSDRLFEMAVVIGKGIDMTEDAIKSRLGINIQNMMEDMNYDFVNYSVLMDEYDGRCSRLVRQIEDNLQNLK